MNNIDNTETEPPVKKPVGRPQVYALDKDRITAMKESKKKYYDNNKEKYQEYYKNKPKTYDVYNKKYKFGGYFMITNGVKGEILFSKSMYFRCNHILREIKDVNENRFNKRYTGDNWKIKYLSYCDAKDNELLETLKSDNPIQSLDD